MVKRKPDVFVKKEEVHSYDTRQKMDVHTTQVTASLAIIYPDVYMGKFVRKSQLTYIKYTDHLVKFKN